MLIINFSHPITPQQLEQISDRLNVRKDKITVFEVPSQVDLDQPILPQVRQMMRRVESRFYGEEVWTREDVLIVPPALNRSAIALAGELALRYSQLGSFLFFKPVPGSTPPRYEFAELLSWEQEQEQQEEEEEIA